MGINNNNPFPIQKNAQIHDINNYPYPAHILLYEPHPYINKC